MKNAHLGWLIFGLVVACDGPMEMGFEPAPSEAAPPANTQGTVSTELDGGALDAPPSTPISVHPTAQPIANPLPVEIPPASDAAAPPEPSGTATTPNLAPVADPSTSPAEPPAPIYAPDPCAALPAYRDGQVAAWTFDEGQGETTDDATGKAHTGSVIGATWIDDGVLGKALRFDGNGYVQVKRSADLDIDGSLTLIAWIRPSTLDELELKILSKASSSTVGYDMGLHTYDVLFGRVGGADGAGRTLAKNGGTMLERWQQLAVTYDGSIGSLYYNGALVHQRTIGGKSGVVASDLFIGKPADRNSLFFVGDIDEVQIWNTALSASDIASSYRCVASRSSFTLPDIPETTPVLPPSGEPGPVPAPPISSDGLVAYYPFSMSGEDASGHGNDAAVKGPLPTTDRFGNANAAYAFDGVDDAVVCDKPAGLPSQANARTIAGWFQSDKPQQYAAALFGYGAAVSAGSFQLTIGPKSIADYPVVFRVNGWGDSSDWRTDVEPTPYLDGRWHHAAVTYEGNQVTVYLDGVAQASSPWRYSTNPASITIGAETSTGGWAYKGALDDVMIFARVLSADEIKTLATN